MSFTKPQFRRSKWSSEKAFVLATAAAAVGLGNIWRFPYIAGENGGAAFILAYLVAVVVIGLPLMMVEIAAGRVERGGVVKTFRALNEHAAIFGWIVVGLTLTIMSYYLVITGWTLGFAVDSLDGSLSSFDEFTSGYKPLLYFFIALAVTAAVTLKGVKLIEITSKMLMPVLLLVILFLAGYGLTLPGSSEALSFLFSPDFSDFNNPVLWALAFGQAFYSLAIGQGYLMTYGSFLPRKINLPRATTTVAAVETGVALIAGLMIFPIVFTFGLAPDEGTELAFSTLPLAFGNLAIGPMLAILFFWLFFLAAISSCIASMQVIKTTIREELRMSNARAVGIAILLLLPLGILSAFSFTPMEIELFGRPFLQFLDMVTANQVVILSGLIGGAIISWSIPKRSIKKLFSRRYRHFAWHVVVATRYLWVGVLAILVASLIT